jgi:LacI family transcriptional regulator
VLHSASELGYVVNLPARSLAGGRSNVIGLLTPGLDNGYIGEVIRGIDEELSRADYDLMMYTAHRRVGKEAEYAKAIANGMADGLIMVVPLAPRELIRVLPQHNFPHVLIDQSDNTNTSPVVDATNWQGAYEAVTYLIRLGHRRIAHITGTLEIASAVQRLDGYRAALRDLGIAYEDRYVINGDFHQQGGQRAASVLLDLPMPPTAIFASNDLSALGAMEAIRARGLYIPRDISVIGFDDIPHAQITYPKLTTIRQPLAQMGRVAARMLLEIIEQPEQPPRHITLATELVVRDTCAPVSEL